MPLLRRKRSSIDVAPTSPASPSAPPRTHTHRRTPSAPSVSVSPPNYRSTRADDSVHVREREGVRQGTRGIVGVSEVRSDGVRGHKVEEDVPPLYARFATVHQTPLDLRSTSRSDAAVVGAATRMDAEKEREREERRARRRERELMKEKEREAASARESDRDREAREKEERRARRREKEAEREREKERETAKDRERRRERKASSGSGVREREREPEKESAREKEKEREREARRALRRAQAAESTLTSQQPQHRPQPAPAPAPASTPSYAPPPDRPPPPPHSTSQFREMFSPASVTLPLAGTQVQSHLQPQFQPFAQIQTQPQHDAQTPAYAYPTSPIQTQNQAQLPSPRRAHTQSQTHRNNASSDQGPPLSPSAAARHRDRERGDRSVREGREGRDRDRERKDGGADGDERTSTRTKSQPSRHHRSGSASASGPTPGALPTPPPSSAGSHSQRVSTNTNMNVNMNMNMNTNLNTNTAFNATYQHEHSYEHQYPPRQNSQREQIQPETLSTAPHSPPRPQHLHALQLPQIQTGSPFSSIKVLAHADDGAGGASPDTGETLRGQEAGEQFERTLQFPLSPPTSLGSGALPPSHPQMSATATGGTQPGWPSLRTGAQPEPKSPQVHDYGQAGSPHQRGFPQLRADDPMSPRYKPQPPLPPPSPQPQVPTHGPGQGQEPDYGTQMQMQAQVGLHAHAHSASSVQGQSQRQPEARADGVAEVSASGNSNTKTGKPRRKYSLLAAFGLKKSVSAGTSATATTGTSTAKGVSGSEAAQEQPTLPYSAPRSRKDSDSRRPRLLHSNQNQNQNQNEYHKPDGERKRGSFSKPGSFSGYSTKNDASAAHPHSHSQQVASPAAAGTSSRPPPPIHGTSSSSSTSNSHHHARASPSSSSHARAHLPGQSRASSAKTTTTATTTSPRSVHRKLPPSIHSVQSAPSSGSSAHRGLPGPAVGPGRQYQQNQQQQQHQRQQHQNQPQHPHRYQQATAPAPAAPPSPASTSIPPPILPPSLPAPNSIPIPPELTPDPYHLPPPPPAVHTYPPPSSSASRYPSPPGHGRQHGHRDVPGPGPVQGRPRIFGMTSGDEDAFANGQQESQGQEDALKGADDPLVQGRPLIFAAMNAPAETGDIRGNDDGKEKEKEKLGEGGADDGNGRLYGDHDYEEIERRGGEDGDGERDYAHMHGYPTPRSPSPADRDQGQDYDQELAARGRVLALGMQDVISQSAQRRQSQSLPPPIRDRGQDSDIERDVEDRDRDRGQDKGSRRLRKLAKVRRGSSQDAARIGMPIALQATSSGSSSGAGTGESPTTPLPRAKHGLGLGLGIAVKMLTERQAERLGARLGRAGSVGSETEGEERRRKAKLRKEKGRVRSQSQSQSRGEDGGREGDAEEGWTRLDEAEVRDAVAEEKSDRRRGRDSREKRVDPPTPVTPEEYAQARARRRGARLGRPQPILPGVDIRVEVEPRKPAAPYPLLRHLLEPPLLAGLLGYLSFAEWCVVARVSKGVRAALEGEKTLRECVLERFLGGVGYARWMWEEKEQEPLMLDLKDLHSYMRGVSIPTYQYAQLAAAYLQSPNDPAQAALAQELAAACRSYTRVVLRLRAQVEAEARWAPPAPPPMDQRSSMSPRRGSSMIRSPPASQYRGFSRSSSRAPSPSSSFTHSYAHGMSASSRARAESVGRTSTGGAAGFQSPLFRPRRAPLLQVFVPSPEGDWLADSSVVACEAELKNAGVMHLLRAGDVVWDVAVGDEANVGRMVWEGAYLIDLDYTWSRTGDLPHYLPTLAFPPSYFHRVIRTAGSGNPICHINIAPWGEEIAKNIQLIQDRTKTETPQGSHHTVVRWVHRSSFTIRPPAPGKSLRVAVPPSVGPGPHPGGVWLVDPGWYGTVVVEAEGTNEGVADLQARCGNAFPGRVMNMTAIERARAGAGGPSEQKREGSMVFRILRERSRPGEIWIRTVRDKERLLPP